MAVRPCHLAELAVAGLVVEGAVGHQHVVHAAHTREEDVLRDQFPAPDTPDRHGLSREERVVYMLKDVGVDVEGGGEGDRESVGGGKSVSVCVELGGHLVFKKKTNNK